MIAIPLDKKCSTVISELYGNSAYFALLNEDTGDFKVIKNEGCGNGLDTAKFISNQNITSTICFYMGEGIYNFLQEKGLKVYSCLKNHVSLDEIYFQLLQERCKEITKSNSSTLLDSGTSSCSCTCNSHK